MTQMTQMTQPTSPTPLTQDQLKTLVGQAALQYVVKGEIVGVGTGSTVNKFIDALGSIKDQIKGAVSSSEASTLRLKALGIQVFDANEVGDLAVYIDGADEIDGQGNMVKGGGAALTREKIVAAQARRFVCIADESKLVGRLGHFPIPVEVIPMAAARVIRQFEAMHANGFGPQAGELTTGQTGGAADALASSQTGARVSARVRMQGSVPLVTDNGQHIIDVTGLQIANPLAFESAVNQWPGVVTVGVFAHQRAQMCLLGTASSVKVMVFRPV